MKSLLSKRPSALALDVIGLGTKVVIPASSRALSSVPLKYPRSAKARSLLLSIASRAACAILLSWARSLPTFVTSWATIRWCGIDRRLHVVAHQARALGLRVHRA